jgi:hypothetical protein
MPEILMNFIRISTAVTLLPIEQAQGRAAESGRRKP